MVSLEFFIDITLPAALRPPVPGLVPGLTTLPLSCAGCHEIWEPQTPGILRACPGLYWKSFTFALLLIYV